MARAAKKKGVKLTADVLDGVDFYGVLGIDRKATQDEIRAAYKRVIRENHPDVNPTAEATEIFIHAQEAFRWLSDPQQRQVYDGVGSHFGEDALYDYTDEAILGSLSKIREIAIVPRAIDLVNMIRKEIYSERGAIVIDKGIKDIRARFRKFGAMRIMFVKNYICRTIRHVLAYPKLIRRLHPFERLSVELALMNHMSRGNPPFGNMLGALKEFRQQIHEEAAYRANASSTAERGRLATFIADQGIKDMFEQLQVYAPIFEQFIEAQRAILRAPVIDLDKPTVVFVGAPNVGKSSLVRSISTGRPEVNSYAFTTKNLTIGNLWHFIAGTPLLIQGQIVDSPGMQHIPGRKGKDTLMDQLTMGSMMHLPTGVVFVFDPYPDSHGILSLDEQVDLRNQLRLKFPRRPWADVITKVDLEADEAQANIDYLSSMFPDALKCSALDGTGLDELNIRIRRLLEEMTKVVRQLQRAKIKQLRTGADYYEYQGKEALVMR